MITTQYTPLEKEYELVSFDDDEFELTGRSISGFRYNEKRYIVQSWKEMLVQVCKFLYDENPSLMTYLARMHEWLDEKELKNHTRINESCYVFTSCSTNTKRTILNYLFKEFHKPANVLEFELEPLVEKVTEAIIE